jgi:hypothetical protein
MPARTWRIRGQLPGRAGALGRAAEDDEAAVGRVGGAVEEPEVDERRRRPGGGRRVDAELGGDLVHAQLAGDGDGLQYVDLSQRQHPPADGVEVGLEPVAAG